MNHSDALTIAFSSLVLLGGCSTFATTTPETDARLGQALTMLQAQQTANPDASTNANPVAGIDGKAAKGILDNYRDSFRVPPAEASGPAVSISAK